MTETAAADAVAEDELAITELVEFDPTRLDGVKSAATGIGFLVMKSAAADPEAETESADAPEPDAAALVTAAITKAVTDGKVDEAPDIDLGQQVMRLLGQAIGSEAQEIVAGSYGETTDVTMLTRAADLVSCWIAREQAVADGKDPNAPCGCCAWCDGIGCGCCVECGPGAVMCAAAEKALLSGKEKNDLPDSAFAYIEDGGKKDADGKTTPRSKRHFPIHDKAHADNAAARIAQGAKFGDAPGVKRKVTAAQKKFGESDDDAGKSVAEGVTDVDTVTQNDQLSELVAAEVAKALKPHEERNESLGAELAKAQAAIARFEAMPRPGGPVMSLTRPLDGLAVKAPGPLDNPGYLRQMADTVTDRETRELYRQAARQAEEKATLTP